ncbi:MAG: OmpA family protein [Cyclobacteriaceae bacterium]|nr:OmpA family protein [Cyclobacteriaceae bacterium]
MNSLMKHVLLIVLLGLSTTGYSQLILKRADKEYKQLHFAAAAELYEEAVMSGAGNDAVYLKAADCYYKIKDPRNAEKYYTKAADSRKSETDWFQYIQCLLQNGKTEEALSRAQQFSSVSTRIANIASVSLAKILADTLVNDVHFLEFNTPFSDFSPVAYRQGLVFVSSRHRGNLHKNVFGWNNTPFLNHYYVDTTGLSKYLHEHDFKREDHVTYDDPNLYAYGERLHTDETRMTSNDTRTAGYFSTYFRKRADTLYFGKEVEPFNPFKSRYHDGPLAFNSTQDLVVFTRNNFSKKSNEGVTNLHLFLSRWSGHAWSNPTPLPFNNANYSVAHPAFNEDMTYLYFASDMPGGAGGTDLYRVAYNNGQWGEPENLGESINTNGNELFPFVNNDILYFASDGHGGLGGLDIFAANLKNPTQLKNIGYPINTNKDDFGLIVNSKGTEGFFSSNRHRTGLDDDIYSFSRTKPVSFTAPIKVLVVDRISEKPIAGASVNAGENLQPCITDENGFCIYEAEPGSYTFTGTKEKYLEGKSSIELSEDLPETTVKVYLTEFGNNLYCRVEDRVTELPLQNVKITVRDKKTGRVFITETTSLQGEMRKALENTKIGDVLNYTFRFERAGYLTKTADFRYTVSKPGEIPVHELMDIKMDKIDLGMDIGKVIHINPIYFDLGKATIRKDATVELDKIVQVMNDNPNMIIELGSHTDCRSSAQYNLSLSDKRAKASAQYIISKGIDKSRISGKGYGESKLVNDCACEGAVKSNCSEEDHQANRRTEFLIVKY